MKIERYWKNYEFLRNIYSTKINESHFENFYGKFKRHTTSTTLLYNIFIKSVLLL